MSRYSRQTKLSEVGEAGQAKLASAKVLVIGAGGLGCAVLPYLASAGIGRLGIIDGDRIEESNLQRQVLYAEAAVKSKKVQEAGKFLKERNSSLNLDIYEQFLNAGNAMEIIQKYDLVIDATDSIAVRYLINDACVLTGKPFIYASVFRFEGQVSVFNYKGGPTYPCLFGNESKNVQNCEEAGVMGTTVGLIGMFQANEAIKLILGIGEVLSGKLLIYNTLSNQQDIFSFEKKPGIEIDQEFFRKTHLSAESLETDAAEALTGNKVLVDVREAGEFPELQLENCIKLPLSQLGNNIHRLDKEAELRIFCAGGVRSMKAVKFLKKQGFKNLKSINGGARKIQKIINYEKEERIY